MNEKQDNTRVVLPKEELVIQKPVRNTIIRMNLTEFSKEVHKDNVEKGFYEDFNELKKYVIDTTYERNQTLKTMFIDQRLALIMSEAGEAVEANRKGRFAKLKEFKQVYAQDVELLDREEDTAFKHNFEIFIKDTLEDEIADTIIRLLDLSGYMGINIQKHIDLKLKFNKLRAHKHGKKY